MADTNTGYSIPTYPPEVIAKLEEVITQAKSEQQSGYQQAAYEKIAELAATDKTLADALNLDYDLLKDAQLFEGVSLGVIQYLADQLTEIMLLDEDGNLTVDLSNYYNKTEVNNKIQSALESSVQSDWAETTTTKSSYIKNKPQTLSSFQNDLGYVKASELSDYNYATKTEVAQDIKDGLTDYATKQYVDDSIANIDVTETLHVATTDYVDEAVKNVTPDTNVIATREFVTSQGYLTSDDLDAKDYATEAYVTQKVAEVASGGTITLTGYATEDYVTQSIADAQPDLSTYATQQYVTDSITALNIPEGTLATNENVLNTLKDYVTTDSYDKNIHIVPYEQLVSGTQEGYEAFTRYQNKFVQIPTSTPIKNTDGTVEFTGLVFVDNEYDPLVNVEEIRTNTDASGITTYSVYATGTFDEDRLKYEYKTNAGGVLISNGIVDTDTSNSSYTKVTYLFTNTSGATAQLHRTYGTSDEIKSYILLSQTDEVSAGNEITWTPYVDSATTATSTIKALEAFSFVTNTQYLFKVEEDKTTIFSSTPLVNLENYATKQYVADAIKDIPKEQPDLTGYATETFVTSQGYATTDYVDQKVAAGSGSSGTGSGTTTDLSGYVTTTDYESDYHIPIIADNDSVTKQSVTENYDSILTKIIFTSISNNEPLTKNGNDNHIYTLAVNKGNGYEDAVTSSSDISIVDADGSLLAGQLRNHTVTVYPNTTYTYTDAYFDGRKIYTNNDGTFTTTYDTISFNGAGLVYEDTNHYYTSDDTNQYVTSEYISAHLDNFLGATAVTPLGGGDITYTLYSIEDITSNIEYVYNIKQDSYNGGFYNDYTATLVSSNPILSDTYATKDYVSQKIASAALSGGDGSSVDLSTYATKIEAQGYASTAEANAKAAIPTNVSSLTNDAGYLTAIPDTYATTEQVNQLLSTSGYVTTDAMNTAIGQLSIPTTVSQLTNDSNYVTETGMESYVTQEIVKVNSGGTISLDGYATIDYVDSKTVSKTSQLTNDSNFITSSYNYLIKSAGTEGQILAWTASGMTWADPSDLNLGTGSGSGSSSSISFETTNLDFSDLSFT